MDDRTENEFERILRHVKTDETKAIVNSIKWLCILVEELSERQFKTFKQMETLASRMKDS